MKLNRYLITKSRQENNESGCYTAFGLRFSGSDYAVSDISVSKKFVSKLCRRLNRCKLDPVHLLDVIEDSI